MPNMKYCQFENTYNDLIECQESLNEYGVKYLLENANQYEKPYILKLIYLCQEINKENDIN